MYEVVERYERPLVRYAARLLSDVEHARDVVQDTFLQLARQDHSKLDGRLPEWLFTVCRNRALDVRKKEARMNELPDDWEDWAETFRCREADHTERLVLQETNGEVADILHSLPEKQQEVIRLQFYGALSYREISRITDLSVSNVGYLIHTAIKTIRGRLVRQAEPARKR